MSKWICNTFCPQANNRKLLHFASHFSARRKCLWPSYTSLGTGAILWQNLKDSDTTSKYWYQPNAWVTTSHCACRWMSVCLGTLQHQDKDPIKIHLKSIGMTSFDFSGLWIGAVTGLYLSPKCCLYFLFLSF